MSKKLYLVNEKLIATNKELNEALNVATEELEHKLRLLGRVPCDEYDIDNADCDQDCGACLKQYLIGKAKDNIEIDESNKVVKDEVDGRTAMDAEDMKLIKLTNRKWETRGNTKWGENVTHKKRKIDNPDML